jgi:hypothetical protein
MNSAMEITVSVKDIQLRHVYLPEYRCRPARCSQDESVCQARMLDGSDVTAISKSYRRDWTQ